MDKLLNPETWVALPVVGPVVAWVFLLSHRVGSMEEFVKEHRKDHQAFGERLASLEATCTAIQQSVQNIERRVLD